MPGFVDAHIHPSIVAEDLLNLDVSSGVVGSLAELTRKVLDQAVATPPGTWIKGTRYDDGKMAEGRLLTRWDLDEVAPDHPVLINQVAGHWAVVNSKALELGGLDDTSEAPPGGEYGRDGAGRLNGVLYERALFQFAYPAVANGETVVPVATLEERLGGLERALAMFHASGLTSLGDALVGPRDLALYQEAERRGILSARINMLLSYDAFSDYRAAEPEDGIRQRPPADRRRSRRSSTARSAGGPACWRSRSRTPRATACRRPRPRSYAEIVRAVHDAGSRLGRPRQRRPRHRAAAGPDRGRRTPRTRARTPTTGSSTAPSSPRRS